MTNEDTEMWREYKKMRQSKRADNREQSAKLLRDAGVVFVSKNEGAHLIVEGPNGFIDFWPGTGKWHVRGIPVEIGFGVRGLINLINGAI